MLTLLSGEYPKQYLKGLQSVMHAACPGFFFFNRRPHYHISMCVRAALICVLITVVKYSLVTIKRYAYV